MASRLNVCEMGYVMLRFVLLVLALVAILFLTLKIGRELRDANLDWRSIALMGGLVALAFYLRQVTDIGGLV